MLRLSAFLSVQALAHDPLVNRWDACTSVAIGPQATAEGSAFVAHTNDCAECDPRMAYVPAKDYPEGASRPVFHSNNDYPRYVGAERSATYAAQPGQADTKPIGFVPQVRHTYAYWEAGYPLMNEHGLGFSESTCAAKLTAKSKADGGNALLCINELMRLAAERCKSAKCAISTMGAAAETYGFYGEDPGEPGAGEHLAVADGESAWVFQITGGLNGTSATWVAQRVPDNHVAVAANNFIIKNVNCKDEEKFMCSPNIFDNARAANLCSFATEKEFDWQRCYGPDIRLFSYTPGFPPIPWYTTVRMWWIQNTANPNLHLTPTDDAWGFAFSVPVRSKLSRTEVMDWLRTHYEGTEFDLTQGILAGPFNNPIRLEGGAGMRVVSGQFARGIAISRTSYALVVEAKPGSNASQSIAWFATDKADTSVYAPFFATANECAESYTAGHQEAFSRESAWWAFNFVANWMSINFRDMWENFVNPAVQEEQALIMKKVQDLENNWPEQQVLNQVQVELQRNLVQRWWTLSDKLVVTYNDGMFTHQNGTKMTTGYPAWWLQMIGFGNDFYRPQWVSWAAQPPQMLSSMAATFLSAPSTNHHSTATFFPGLLLGLVIGASSMAVIRSRKVTATNLNAPLIQ